MRAGNQPRPPKGLPAGGQCKPVTRIGADVVLPSISNNEQPDEGLVRARAVLLTGLRALGPQREALTVVGAQAVFEHTRGRSDIPFTLTIDADTSVAPSLVDASFDIGQAMVAAGFVAHPDRPGIWGLPGVGDETIGFDLLVPGAVAGPGRRRAKVAGQDRHAIGRADGLELSLLDREKRVISSLDGSERSIEAYVAGPAALMCAKAYKIHERLAEALAGGRNRIKPKDAADVWRLMMVSEPGEVGSVFADGERDAALGEAIRKGRNYLEELFGPNGDGIELAQAGLRGLVPDGKVSVVISTWMSRFSRKV